MAEGAADTLKAGTDMSCAGQSPLPCFQLLFLVSLFFFLLILLLLTLDVSFLGSCLLSPSS